MIDIFIDSGDHFLFNILLNKKSTIIISLQVKNITSNKTKIIVFTSITPIKNKNRNCLTIVDYIGVCDDEERPKTFIPTFEHERYRGKGIGKFLIHMTQVISNILCENKENVILLKCNQNVHTFYECIGFEQINHDDNWLKIPNVAKHYVEIKAAKKLYQYILKSNTTIDHHSVTFVNHVEQKLKNKLLLKNTEIKDIPVKKIQ